jgi:hypothetical protein
MKKKLSPIIIAFAINSCDDGNLVQEDISFADVTTTQVALMVSFTS